MRFFVKKIISFFFTRYLYSIARPIGSGVRANGLVRANNLSIGSNSHFNGMHVYGRGHVRIGNNFHSATGLRILTESHNYLGKTLPYDDSTIIKNIEIGNNVWIGMDVLIIGTVRIGNGVIIQAGSVVVSDICDLGIAGGNPAKIFKYRDAIHYKLHDEEN